MTARSQDRRTKTSTGPRRGGKGFRHASETARKSVDQIVGRSGFAEADVLLRWSEIAGEALSASCRPVKVQYGANRNLGAVLIVQADSGRAPEVTHLGPQIVERVNRFYGYRAISRLKVTQSTGYGSAHARPGFAERQTPFDGPGTPGTDVSKPPEIRRDASELASSIQNEELRAALEMMGSHVLSRSKPTKPDA